MTLWTPTTAGAMQLQGVADVITVGAMALANPDLPERLRAGAELNQPDPTTFYRGYTDYPALDQLVYESSSR